MFTYKAARHHAPIEDEYETLAEAIQRAGRDRDSGKALPVEIVDSAGTILLDHDAIYAALDYAPGYVPPLGIPDATYLGTTLNGTRFSVDE